MKRGIIEHDPLIGWLDFKAVSLIEWRGAIVLLGSTPIIYTYYIVTVETVVMLITIGRLYYIVRV